MSVAKRTPPQRPQQPGRLNHCIPPEPSLVCINSSCSVPEKMHAQKVLKEHGLVGARYPRRMAEVPEAVRPYFEAVAAE